jgi:NAD dependent epimerase/dehydratase
MARRTILVTGAGGFIGSHVVELLLRGNYDVRALVHYNSFDRWGHLQRFAKKPHPRLTVLAGDVADARCVEEAARGCRTVLHLAALIGIPYSYQAPESYVDANIRGTLNVLEAGRKLGTERIIVTSTSEVYGTARFTPMTEDHPLQGQSPYSATKIAADKLAESYFLSYALPVVTLRPFNTYGPRQSARASIPTILTQALSGTKRIRLGNLEPKRDLTFVEDSARAFVLAAETAGIEGQTIHFGQGKAISIGELAQLCLKVVGSKARIVTETARRRPPGSEVDLLLCEPAKARKLLGWAPQVSLEDGLRRTADYLREHLDEYRLDYVV